MTGTEGAWLILIFSIVFLIAVLIEIAWDKVKERNGRE
jgi:hypothetical protein